MNTRIKYRLIETLLISICCLIGTTIIVLVCVFCSSDETRVEFNRNERQCTKITIDCSHTKRCHSINGKCVFTGKCPTDMMFYGNFGFILIMLSVGLVAYIIHDYYDNKVRSYTNIT